MSLIQSDSPNTRILHLPDLLPLLASLLLLEGEVAHALHLVLVRVDLLQNIGQKLGEVVIRSGDQEVIGWSGDGRMIRMSSGC